MSLKTVLDRLTIIENVSSTNDKVTELAKYLEDPVFRKVVQYAYNQGWSYNLKDVDFVEESTATEIDKIFEYLDFLKQKGGATNVEKAKFNWICSIDKETVEVVSRICKKDLRAGFKFKTISKAKKGIVEEVPYQRCSTEDEIHRVHYPAMAQKKADGMFVYGFPWKENEIFTTRYGSTFHLYGYLKQELLELLNGEKYVTVGEFLVIDEDGKVLDRKTGNGILNSFIQGGGSEEIAERIIYVMWGLIPFEHYEKKFSPITYAQMFPKLCDMVDKFLAKNYPVGGLGPIEVIPYEIVHSEEEARDFYKRMREQGFEGAVLKDLSEIWKPTTSRRFIKLKNRGFAEFRIVKALPGTKGKQYEHCLGSLVVRTEDSGIITEIGKGFSKEERELGIEWWDSHIDDIVTCSFESVITDKTNRQTKKLFLESFEETRFNEKWEADTTEYCENQCIANKVAEEKASNKEKSKCNPKNLKIKSLL